MDNRLTNFPSTTEYPESEKEQFVEEKFSASDYEKSGTDKFNNEPIYSLKNELKKDSENVVQDTGVDTLLKDAFINFNNEFLKRFTKLDSSLISLNTKLADNLKGISEIDSIDINKEDSSLGQDVLKLIDTTLTKFLEYSEEDNQSLLFRIKGLSKKYDEKKSLLTLDGILSLIGSWVSNKEKDSEKAEGLFGKESTKLLMFLGGSFLLGGIGYSLLDDIFGKVSLDKVVDDLMEAGVEIEYNGPVKGDKKQPPKDPNSPNEGYEKVIENFRKKADGPYAMEEKVFQATEGTTQQSPSDTSALTFTERTGSKEHYEKVNPELRSRVEAMAKEYKQITKNNLIISSAFRSEEENKSVGGAKNSRHKSGLAVDIQPSQVNEARRMGLLEKHGLDAPFSKSHPEHVQLSGNSSVSRVEPVKEEPKVSTPPTPFGTGSYTKLSENIGVPVTDNRPMFNFLNQGSPTLSAAAKFLNKNVFNGSLFQETRDSFLQLHENVQNLNVNTTVNVNATSFNTNTERTHNPDITQ